MRPLFLLVLLFLLIISQFGCYSVQNGPYRTRSYVRVGRLMGRVQPPYVIDLRRDGKRLVFIGCDHVTDSTHRQFDTIERYMADVRPQVAFNEGGQVKASVHDPSRNTAIVRNGEIGCLKFLCDRAGISMLNGDLTDSLEFALMLTKYPKQELFLYYAMERLVIPYLYGAYGKQPFEEFYAADTKNYFVKAGFPLAESEQNLLFFKQLYQTQMGHEFVLTLNEDIERFDYVNGGDCRFCALGRASKMMRDSTLLAKLDQALDRYDRVIVAFGHGHALALEPALRQLMQKKQQLASALTVPENRPGTRPSR